MKGDVDLYLELLQPCKKCDGFGVNFVGANDKVPCAPCYGTGKVPTYDGHEVIQLLEWLEAKKGA